MQYYPRRHQNHPVLKDQRTEAIKAETTQADRIAARLTKLRTGGKQ